MVNDIMSNQVRYVRIKLNIPVCKNKWRYLELFIGSDTALHSCSLLVVEMSRFTPANAPE